MTSLHAGEKTVLNEVVRDQRILFVDEKVSIYDIQLLITGVADVRVGQSARVR